jgi:hypothetical protein
MGDREHLTGVSALLEILLQAVSDGWPRLARIGAGSSSRCPLLDLRRPSIFSVRVNLGIEARDELRRELRASRGVEFQGLLKESGRFLRHGDEGSAGVVT